MGKLPRYGTRRRDEITVIFMQKTKTLPYPSTLLRTGMAGLNVNRDFMSIRVNPSSALGTASVKSVVSFFIC